MNCSNDNAGEAIKFIVIGLSATVATYLALLLRDQFFVNSVAYHFLGGFGFLFGYTISFFGNMFYVFNKAVNNLKDFFPYLLRFIVASVNLSIAFAITLSFLQSFFDFEESFLFCVIMGAIINFFVFRFFVFGYRNEVPRQ